MPRFTTDIVVIGRDVSPLICVFAVKCAVEWGVLCALECAVEHIVKCVMACTVEKQSSVWCRHRGMWGIGGVVKGWDAL